MLYVVAEARYDHLDVLDHVLKCRMVLELQIDCLVIEQRVDQVRVVAQAVYQARVDYLEDHSHELLDDCQILEEVLPAVRLVQLLLLTSLTGAGRGRSACLCVQSNNDFRSLLRQQIEQAVDALTHVRMQVVELGGHVGQSGQAVRVQVLVAHASHVELYGSYDDQDEQAAQADLGQGALGEPIQSLYNLICFGNRKIKLFVA